MQINNYVNMNNGPKPTDLIVCTELFDMDFHVALMSDRTAPTFGTWDAECYDAIMEYRRSGAREDAQIAALRIGQTAWEAAEADASLGEWLYAVARNWEHGIKDGRHVDDWTRMPWTLETVELYVAKTLRHFIQAGMAINQDVKIKHLAALFCNANILWKRAGEQTMLGE